MTISKQIPEKIKQFWTDSPTKYTKSDIAALEPDSEIAVFLKYLLQNGFSTLTIQLNGDNIGVYNGGEPKTLNIKLGQLTIKKNGVSIGSYDGSASAEIDLNFPNISSGTNPPSGGNDGDIYMRYS